MTRKPSTSNALTFEEKYGVATVSRNLRLDENRRGAVNLLIAAGVASRPEFGRGSNASRPLGGALTRLMTEWHQVAKPKRMLVPNARECARMLPLVKVGEKTDFYGKLVPIMGRDKNGACSFRHAQQKISDLSYRSEIILLAQKLPSRIEVRQVLFEMTPGANFDEKNHLVASVIVHWLTRKCHTCCGTGLVKLAGRERTCLDCKGGSESPVPGQDIGRAILGFMDHSQASWVSALKSTYRKIHSN